MIISPRMGNVPKARPYMVAEGVSWDSGTATFREYLCRQNNESPPHGGGLTALSEAGNEM